MVDERQELEADLSKKLKGKGFFETVEVDFEGRTFKINMFVCVLSWLFVTGLHGGFLVGLAGAVYGMIYSDFLFCVIALRIIVFAGFNGLLYVICMFKMNWGRSHGK